MTSAYVDSIWLPMAIVLNSDSLDHESRLYYFLYLLSNHPVGLVYV